MAERNFTDLIQVRQGNGKYVCVGLDSDLSKIPQVVLNDKKEAVPRDNAEEVMYWFNRAIVDATCDLVCAYKMNWAFYHAEGPAGLSALKRTVEYIGKRTGWRVPVIGDLKEGDIGNSNKGYVKAIEYYDFDAATLPPYMGGESLQPFLDLKNKGFFVLCRTSNPGGGEFQDLLIPVDNLPEEAREFFRHFGNRGNKACRIAVQLHEYVAYQFANRWNANGNVGLVVGATRPEELWNIRQIVGDMPLLLPGIGAQGGGIEGAVRNGVSGRKKDLLVHSAREVIFASGGEDYPVAARQATEKLDKEIKSVLAGIPGQ